MWRCMDRLNASLWVSVCAHVFSNRRVSKFFGRLLSVALAFSVPCSLREMDGLVVRRPMHVYRPPLVGNDRENLANTATISTNCWSRAGHSLQSNTVHATASDSSMAAVPQSFRLPWCQWTKCLPFCHTVCGWRPPVPSSLWRHEIHGNYHY